MITAINSSLRVFRDDLYPFLGGGNKGRKILAIEKDILIKGCDAIVTTGGIQSNHCRAAAVLAASRGWECTLVLHGSHEDFDAENGNALLMRVSGANIVFADPLQIGDEMDKAMDDYRLKGLEPYYIWGGGHTFDGGLAYIEAVRELKEYCTDNSWYPDYIFHASGTGSTQAGLLAGLDKYDLSSKVVGISVARTRTRAEEVVGSFYNELTEHYSIKSTGRRVEVSDDYLFGGYEKYSSELLELSRSSIKTYGFALDTTYTGKAFIGMQDYIKKNQIEGNVLFWHTGGILNFLAQKF